MAREGTPSSVLDLPGNSDSNKVEIEETNPWASTTGNTKNPSAEESQSSHMSHLETMPIPTPPPELFTLPPDLPKPDPTVLDEFDPLMSDIVKKEGHEAWANAEGHLPPSSEKDLLLTTTELAMKQTQTPSQPRASVESLAAPQSAPAIISSFSSLANLAKSLTLSPKRSGTPPLPPPPRSSSLRHSHTNSLPSNSTIPSPPPKENGTEFSNEDRLMPSISRTPPRVTNSPTGSEGNFDFQKFLDQMKMKGAEPVASYLRSFLSNFSKKTFTVKDQIKIIHDFLDFIGEKMRDMEGTPWQNVSQQEFDNAMEAMEKIIMNRLYDFTFQPLLSPGSRTTDDIERDHVLGQRILLFSWLREEHLDVPRGENIPGGKEVKGFLDFAQQELLKINHYKAPRDKLICILNCCKVIFGLIRHVKLAEGADSFIPILIFVVLKANPDHLVSNIEYINRFRRPDKLRSEAGYYLSSLMGAVSFIETMDHTSLSNISQEEFERNVEAAIEALPDTPTPPTLPTTPRTPKAPYTIPPNQSVSSSLAGEEPAEPLSLPIPSASRPPQVSLAEDTRKFFQRTSDTISKPLTAIGRIFTEVLDEGPFSSQKEKEGQPSGWRSLPGPFAPLSVGGSQQSQSQWSQYPGASSRVPHTPTPMHDAPYQPPIQTPYKPRVRPSHSTASPGPSTGGADSPTRSNPPSNYVIPRQQQTSPLPLPNLPESQLRTSLSAHPSRNPTPTLDFIALQDEIDRAHLAARDAARETLRQIFPTVDREVADMVLEANDGDLGKSIEQLLEISGGGTGG